MVKSTLLAIATFVMISLSATAQIDSYWQSLHVECGLPLSSSAVDSVMLQLVDNPQLYREMADKAESTFYRPGSDFFDDVTYNMFLTRFLSDSIFDPTTLSRYEYQAKDVRKNLPGSEAADFEMVDKSGKKLTLFTAAPTGASTLLIFYDPDCDHCRESFNILRRNADLTNLVKAKKIKVIAVYADSDPDVWNNNPIILPPDWVNAYTPDATVEDLDLYSFPEMPSIYLIDPNHVVIRKNITTEHLIPVLKSMDN